MARKHIDLYRLDNIQIGRHKAQERTASKRADIRKSLLEMNGIQLPTVLKGCEANSSSLTKQHRNTAHENMALSDMEVSDEDIEAVVIEADKVANHLLHFRGITVTDYGSRIPNPFSLPSCVSVMSYNVLAQELLQRHRQLYKKCHRRNLLWNVRKEILLEEFALINADILCLQEVQEEHVQSFYAPELEKKNYVGIYKKRTGDKIDGCAIYFKRDKFKLIAASGVNLYKNNVRLLDRDNIGIILRLRGKWPGAEDFIIATTHLLYNPRRNDIRLTQTQVMLAEIDKAAYNGAGNYCPVIFTGDMNYTPESPVYKLVSQGNLTYEGDIDSVYLPKTLLPPRLGVTDRCQYNYSQGLREANVTPQYQSGTLSHGLNFASAYNHVRDGLPEATTYQNEWRTVDYIFYSQKVINGSREEGDLKLVSLLKLPTTEEANDVIVKLPNERCGSDHLPLVAHFHLCKS